MGRWLVSGLIGCLGLVRLSAATVQYVEMSDPPTLFASTSVVSTPLVVVTRTAPAQAGTLRFTHWTINGVRTNDFTGRSLNPVRFTIYEPTIAVAHYLPAQQDSDSDGVPDWFEIEYYGDLGPDAASDTDLDGYRLLEELAAGTHPRLKDEIVPGGITVHRSPAVAVNFAGWPWYQIVSEPPGLIVQSNLVPPGTIVQTPDYWNHEIQGSRFAFWDIGGIRQADSLGIALGRIRFSVTTNTVVTAHFYALQEDRDADGVPDWFELMYFPSLEVQDGGSDADGDGWTLRHEYLQQTVPRLADELVPGGVVVVRSAAVVLNFAGWPWYQILSQPPGLLVQSNLVPPGTVIRTPDLWGREMGGYRFAFWSLDGIRQEDSLGIALGMVQVPVVSNVLLTAHFHPVRGDEDADGVPDWFELTYFPSLELQDGASDADGDGWTVAQESLLGTVPKLADVWVPGGVTIVRTPALWVDLQPFERMQFVLIDGVTSNFFAGPSGSGGVRFGTDAAPALGDWDGDGDLDLFIGHTPGELRIWENIGSPYNLHLSERTAAFALLAPLWSGWRRPVPALGDWNGDGRDDLVVGGSGDTLLLVASTGHFGSPQEPAPVRSFATGSEIAGTALGDVDGDGWADLLVLRSTGTADLYLNRRDPAQPFASPATRSPLLPEPVPGPSGLAVADVNYDGQVDVLVADSSGRIWEFHRDPATEQFRLVSKVWAGTGAGFALLQGVAVGDVDGDGDLDLIGGTAEGALLALRDPSNAIPTGLQATVGPRTVLLTWAPDLHFRVAGYHVYRSVGSTQAFERLTSQWLPVPRFEDQQATPGVTHHYRVTAVRVRTSGGTGAELVVESRPSDIVSVVPGGLTLGMSDTFAAPGSNVVLQINTPLATGITGTNLEIRVRYDPSRLRPRSQIDPSRPTVERTALTESLRLRDNAAEAAGELVLWGEGGGPLQGRGNLLDLHFQLSPDAVPGTRITNVVVAARLFDSAGVELPVHIVGPAVCVVSDRYWAGDVTGDGVLDPQDFELALRLAAGQRAPTAAELAALDMNGNGVADEDDAHQILRMIHGRNPNPE